MFLNSAHDKKKSGNLRKVRTYVRDFMTKCS